MSSKFVVSILACLMLISALSIQAFASPEGGFETIIRGKDTAYNLNIYGDEPWVWYTVGDLPPIMAAKRAGSGAVVAAGTARTGNGGITYPTLRWRVGEYDVLLDKAFQWMVLGATKVLWYGKYGVGYNVYNDAGRCSWLIDELRAKGYTVDDTGVTPITSDLLEPYDILVIPQLQLGAPGTGGDPALLPDADVQAIKNFVEGGKGLLIMEGSDFAWYNYYKVQNKILSALDMGIYFQDDSVYDDVNNWNNLNYWPVVDVNPTSEIGAAYQAATGKTTVTLYSISSLAVLGCFTPTGENVQVTPVPGVSVAFDNVTTGGTTTVTTSTAGQAPPTGYKIVGISGRPIYYDITTTAAYSGNIIISISYDPTQIPPGSQENDLTLWQLIGKKWKPITTWVDTVNNMIYGSTTTLSIFIIAGPTPPVGGIAFPADKLALLAPWIILAVLIAIAAVTVAVYWRRYRT